MPKFLSLLVLVAFATFSTQAVAIDANGMLSDEDIRDGCKVQTRVAFNACVSAVQLHQSKERLKELEAKVAQLSSAPAPAPAPAPVATTPVRRVATARPRATVVQTAVREDWLSIRPLPGEPDVLHITRANTVESKRNCGGTQASQYLMVTNHGVPVQKVWSPAGAPTTGFKPVYYDANSDGTADASVVVLDLESQDDFYVTWRTGDDLKFYYLYRSEKAALIHVDGLGWQEVWRKPNKGDSSILGCEMDVLERPGGKDRKIETDRLAKIRP